MKKTILFQILFGLVITYLAALLVFVTCKHVFIMNKDDLSIFASILSAGATVFAAFVAYLLYDNWQDIYKKNLEKEACIKALSLIEELHFSFIHSAEKLNETFNAIKNGKSFNLAPIPDPEYNLIILDRIEFSILNIKALNKDQDIQILFNSYRDSCASLISQMSIFLVKREIDSQQYPWPYPIQDIPFVHLFKLNLEGASPYPDKVDQYKNSFEHLIITLNATIEKC